MNVMKRKSQPYRKTDYKPIIYSKEFQKLQPTHGGTISNSENGQMVYIYSSYVIMHFQIYYHIVVIFIASIYMVVMMSACVLTCI